MATQETLKALEEAANGEFASEKEVSNLFNKWSENIQKGSESCLQIVKGDYD